ncbi:MAG: chromosomal replication initiator protein DnaA [Roseimicrobium sp.]
MSEIPADATPEGELPLLIGPHRGHPVWVSAQARLRREIGEQSYERWFARAGVEKVDGARVVLRVPNLMHQYWIEDHYLPSLRKALSDALGAPAELEFIVFADPVKEAPVPQRDAARRPEDAVSDGTISAGPLFQDQRFFKKLTESGLNHRFTFDTFVVGPNSAYSFAVAKAVAEKPGKTYNPLFLHGAVGLGKTHLMQAIGQEIMRNKPRKVVRYFTCENFTGEYVEALRQHKVVAFREKYRKVDVLLVDDINFLAGKGSTQEEFFHTFNDLFNSFKQIVLTSDLPPSEIKNIEGRLVSRFEWGMATMIEAPDLETRTAILRQKMLDWSVRIEDSVLTYLAQNIRTNVRRLEGALMRVAGHISIRTGEPLTRESLDGLLRDIIEDCESKAITIDHIQKVVAEHFDIRLADMTSHRRPATIAWPRQIAMFLAREMTKASLKEIGEAFGGRDHGTVIHACKTAEKKLTADEELRRTLQTLRDKLRRTD